MKIGIIARGLTKGGVTRFVTNILRELDRQASHGVEVVIFTDDTSFINQFVHAKVCVIPRSSRLFWDYLKVLPALWKENVDVLVYPKTIIPITHFLCRTKRVVVVHDLAYFAPGLNEYTFFDTLYMKLLMGFSTRFADAVLAVSAATRKDLVTVLSTNPNKITVIHEGIEDSFKKEINATELARTLAKYAIKTPYLFYCGSLSPRKNMLRTLEAFFDCKEKIPHQLYITGGQSWHDAPVKKYLAEHLADRVHVLGHVSDNELVHLYSASDLYLYPSLYEGFGLPILEAQTCGTVVLTSQEGACAEVAGLGAILVDPLEKVSITEGILLATGDERKRDELIAFGRENLQRFSWEATTQKIITTCKQLLA